MFIQLGSFSPSREPDIPSALGVGPLGAYSTRVGGLVASPVSHHACDGLIKTFSFRRCKGEDGGRKHRLTTGTALSQAIYRFARLHKRTATKSARRLACAAYSIYSMIASMNLQCYTNLRKTKHLAKHTKRLVSMNQKSDTAISPLRDHTDERPP